MKNLEPEAGTCSDYARNFSTVHHANDYTITICELGAMDIAGEYRPLNNVARGKAARQSTESRGDAAARAAARWARVSAPLRAASARAGACPGS